MRILLFLCSISIFAQQSKIDSLMNSIKNMDDSSKVKFLADFAWKNRSRTPDLALQAGQKAYDIAEHDDINSLQARTLNIIGVIYRNLGKYDLSISIYNKALKISQDLGDSIQIAYSYNNIGGIYRLEGNNKIALEYILKALRIFERQNYKEGISFCTINIGLIHRRQQNYEKALEYLNYTVEIRNEIGDKPGKALALNLIAEVYYDLGQIDKALKYYYDVEKQYTEVDDKKGLAATWGGIGGVWFDKKDYNKALEYRLRALDMSLKIKYLEGQVNNYNNLGKIYAKLQKWNKADVSFTNALKIANGLREIYTQLECYRFLKDYNELKKDFKTAYLYGSKYYTLKDSVYKKENSDFVAEMEALYSNQKIENENVLLLKENELQKKQALYLIGLIIVISFFAVVVYRKALLTKKLNVKLDELNTLKDKFFRIIAHDLRNPFHSLLGYSEILESDYEMMSDKEKIEFIKELRISIKSNYHLLENLLFWAGSQRNEIIPSFNKINLAAVVDEILLLFQVSCRNKDITVTKEIGSDVFVLADIDMLKSIIRNLISNAIKFTPGGGAIFLTGKSYGNNAVLTIKDTGGGMPQEKIDKLFRLDKLDVTMGTAGEKGTGLGLILCKEFIEKLGGTISVQCVEGDGCSFNLSLPIANEKEN